MRSTKTNLGVHSARYIPTAVSKSLIHGRRRELLEVLTVYLSEETEENHGKIYYI